mgnify:CR=1 FL=1
MEHLKKAIKTAINKAGIENALKQESAVFLWKEVVGRKVAKAAKAEKVDRGTLIVKTDSAVWRQELQMQKEQLIEKINKKIGSEAIKEIRFI